MLSTPCQFSSLATSCSAENNTNDILFGLCAEILAQAIRNNSNIKGIQIYDKEYKISQYAGDTTAFVSDASSAENLFELLSIFRDVSGLELNKSKTVKECG